MKFIHDYRLVVISYLVLILSQVLDTVMSGYSANTQWIVVAIRVAPLLLLGKAITHETPRLYIWLCFMLMGYFIGATLGTFSPSRTAWDAVALGSSVVLFLSAMFRSRHLSQQLSDNSDVTKD